MLALCCRYCHWCTGPPGDLPPPCATPDGGAETQRAGWAGTLSSLQAQQQVASASPFSPCSFTAFFSFLFFFFFFTA